MQLFIWSEGVGYELLITEGPYDMQLLDGSSDDLFHHHPLVPLACLQQRKEWMEAFCVKETSAVDLDGVQGGLFPTPLCHLQQMEVLALLP